MFKNSKLGAKIGVGFIIVLVLLLGVAYVGFNGLSGVTDRVDKADDMTRITQSALKARSVERDYILGGDEKYIGKVSESLGAIKKQAIETSDKFKAAANRQQMDKIVTAADRYGEKFGNYVAIEHKVKDGIRDMTKNGGTLIAVAETIRADQKKALADIMAGSNTRMKAKMTLADDANRLIKLAFEATRHEKEYMLSQDTTYVDLVHKVALDIVDLARNMKNRFVDADDQQLADQAIAVVTDYQTAFNKYVDTGSQATVKALSKNSKNLIIIAEVIRDDQKKALTEIMADSNAGIKDKMARADDANRFIKLALETRQSEKDYMLGGDRAYIDRVHKTGLDIVNLAKDLKDRFVDADDQQLAVQVIAAAQNYKVNFDKVVSLKEQQKTVIAEMGAAARDVLKISDEAAASQKARMEGQISSANRIMLLGTAVAILFGSLIAFFMTRGITRPLNKAIQGLNEGADQVVSASGQVSSASQSLAEGSSEQAASLEETSSSLEEMASMTKRNADNASQADHLMKEASRVIGTANASMKEMAASMDDISEASTQTSKIIKTIDEIAFQTNLLALNAAVEAARAGEAGAGFAVVADEVKNLAMRSAEAARNTADLIEGTVKKVADGSMLVDKTNEGFTAVSDSAGKVAELVAEIAAASNEQAHGIEQVNTAVMDMDKVTQQNAANAEESASASEEMNAQAEQMKAVVGELVTLVGGNGAGAKGDGVSNATAGKELKDNQLQAIEKQPVVSHPASHPATEISPRQAIPMDDDDFKDF